MKRRHHVHEGYHPPVHEGYHPPVHEGYPPRLAGRRIYPPRLAGRRIYPPWCTDEGYPPWCTDEGIPTRVYTRLYTYHGVYPAIYSPRYTHHPGNTMHTPHPWPACQRTQCPGSGGTTRPWALTRE